MDDETHFRTFLDASPLDVQQKTFTYLTQDSTSYVPPHLGLLKSRIEDLEVRDKLQMEVGGSGAHIKKRVM